MQYFSENNTGNRKTVLPVLLLLGAMLFCLLGPAKASAHPHVFVDCSLTFEFNDNGLAGVRQKWWFDEMFAAMILGDFDKNHDNKLTPDEAKALEQGAFVNLKNFNYFTRILVDGKEHTPIEAIRFKPSIEDGTLVYEFFVPLQIADKAKHVVMVAIYDESFYTAVQMDPQNKVLGISGKYKTSLDLEPVAEMAYFYDQIVPEAAVLTLLPQ
ncbi:DUF1007 family protein [Desulfovibrio sp. JC010]|uniref:DUF1007 family protein n=1 Tax=Desulfovibrio sp. JC010 TaxID=2593641 RepID=UPI0013D76DCB|nr:DUF1007 family protein [Desulfovibrio sp. JC010]NDV26072.1 DUF1007 family protein [Desulfovibrio sp. JC010]